MCINISAEFNIVHNKKKFFETIDFKRQYSTALYEQCPLQKIVWREGRQRPLAFHKALFIVKEPIQ